MSIDVQLKKQTAEAFKRKLKKARASIKNNLPAMTQVSIFLDRWVQQNFKGKGVNVGGWEPFMYGGRLTTKAKANAQSLDGHRYINGAAVLLQDTGALRHSFLPFVKLGTAGIGSDLPYAKMHEDGGKHVPARRMLPKDVEVVVEVREILNDFIFLRVKKANA